LDFEQPLFDTQHDGTIDSFGVPSRLIDPSDSNDTWTVYDYLEYNDRTQYTIFTVNAVDPHHSEISTC